MLSLSFVAFEGREPTAGSRLRGRRSLFFEGRTVGEVREDVARAGVRRGRAHALPAGAEGSRAPGASLRCTSRR